MDCRRSVRHSCGGKGKKRKRFRDKAERDVCGTRLSGGFVGGGISVSPFEVVLGDGANGRHDLAEFSSLHASESKVPHAEITQEGEITGFNIITYHKHRFTIRWHMLCLLFTFNCCVSYCRLTPLVSATWTSQRFHQQRKFFL